jgi:hypothetical protein
MALLGDLWVPHYYHKSHRECAEEQARIEFWLTMMFVPLCSAGILPAIVELE